MKTDKRGVLLKKLKLLILGLLIAFFNLGGIRIPPFGECPSFDAPNVEDSPEKAAILLRVFISLFEEELLAQETKVATATVDCGADECPMEDFFSWIPVSGPGLTAVFTQTSQTEATLQFTADDAEAIRNSGLPFNLPLFAQGPVRAKSYAEALVVPSIAGVEVEEGGLIDVALFTSAEDQTSSFPALGHAEVLFSPPNRLDFGEVAVNGSSPIREVYIANKSLGFMPGEGARIDSVSISGSSALEFTQNPSASDSFLGGISGLDSATVAVQLFPSSEGFKSSTLTISYTLIQTEFRLGFQGERVETPMSVNIQLTGTGIPAPEPGAHAVLPEIPN